MHKNKTLNISIIALLLLFTSTKVWADDISKKIDRIEKSDKALFDYYFFKALDYRNQQKFDAYYDALQMCVNLDSTKAVVQYELADIYRLSDRLNEAENAYAKAAASDSSNWLYQVSYISILIDQEKTEKAIEQTLLLKKSFPYREEVYRLLAQLYEQSEEYKKAIDALNMLEVYAGVNQELSLQKFRYYAKLDETSKAVKELENLVETYPKVSWYRVLLGDVYMNINKSKQAFKQFQRVLKDDPENPFVYVSLFQYYTDRGEKKKANDAIYNAIQNPELEVETKLEVLGRYLSSSRTDSTSYDNANELFKTLVDMYPLSEEVYGFYSFFLEQNKSYDEAIEVLQSGININSKNDDFWNAALRILLKQENNDEIIKLTSRGIDEVPDNATLYYYRSIALYQNDKYEEAIENNKLAIERLSDKVTPALLSDFYTLMGDIYYKLEDKEQSFFSYESALQLNPNNIYVMNNYAYYLSETNQDLLKAENLSSKTVEAEPTNSTYLDTYAWIFYKQGNFTLAKIYIEKALEHMDKEEESQVLYDHCGDIYLALDMQSKAMEMWKKAFSLDEENEEIRLKIEKYNGN